MIRKIRLAKKYMTTVLKADRIFEAAFLTVVADLNTAKQTKKLMANQNTTSSRSDPNENQ
jgi:hypothetical protein